MENWTLAWLTPPPTSRDHVITRPRSKTEEGEEARASSITKTLMWIEEHVGPALALPLRRLSAGSQKIPHPVSCVTGNVSAKAGGYSCHVRGTKHPFPFPSISRLQISSSNFREHFTHQIPILKSNHFETDRSAKNDGILTALIAKSIVIFLQKKVHKRFVLRWC